MGIKKEIHEYACACGDTDSPASGLIKVLLSGNDMNSVSI